MANQALMISVLVFVMSLLVMFGAFSLVQSRKTAKDWGDRIRGQSKTAESTQTDQGMAYVSGLFLKVLERLGQANKPKNQTENSQLKSQLVQAGYRGSRAPVIFLGSKMFLALLCLALAFIFGGDISQKIPGKNFPAFIVGCALAGFYAPQLWLSMAVSRRKERLVDGFPDALDLMVVCVESGLGLDQTIARVGEEIKLGHKELAEEFKIVSLESRAGFSREQVLRNLGTRTEIDEIRSLIALLIQTDRFGTSIGQALRVHSDSMRMNRKLRAEELAAKLPVKLMVPLILFIFPSLLVVIIGPGAIRLIRNFLPAMGG
jgi:tight adherence protein C